MKNAYSVNLHEDFLVRSFLDRKLGIARDSGQASPPSAPKEPRQGARAAEVGAWHVAYEEWSQSKLQGSSLAGVNASPAGDRGQAKRFHVSLQAISRLFPWEAKQGSHAARSASPQHSAAQQHPRTSSRAHSRVAERSSLYRGKHNAKLILYYMKKLCEIRKLINLIDRETSCIISGQAKCFPTAMPGPCAFGGSSSDACTRSLARTLAAYKGCGGHGTRSGRGNATTASRGARTAQRRQSDAGRRARIGGAPMVPRSCLGGTSRGGLWRLSSNVAPRNGNARGIARSLNRLYWIKYKFNVNYALNRKNSYYLKAKGAICSERLHAYLRARPAGMRSLALAPTRFDQADGHDKRNLKRKHARIIYAK